MRTRDAALRALALASALLLGMPAPGGAQADAAAQLAGVWGVERELGPEIAGAVTVVRSGAGWSAYAAGFTADGTLLDGMPVFRFPGDRGELRVDLARRTGYWLQPAGVTHSRYASPVALAAAGAHAWRGTIVPLADRIEAYLVFVRGADGALTAFLRDPVANRGLRLRIARVAVDGERVRLIAQNAEYDGTLDAKHETLSIALPSYPGTLDFTRRDALHAAGLYARTPMPAHVVLAPPLPANDGWPVASLRAVGMKEAPIQALLDRVLATPVDGVRAPYVQSLLIARHGKLVVDEYFHGFSADRPHDMRSAGKTLDDALVGIAMARGGRIAEQTPIAPSYRRYAPFANADPRKARITVANLLTMSSGLSCDDNDDDSPGQEDRVQELPDWYRATLDLPMKDDPGSRAVYCSQGLNLLGGVLTESTHAWLPAFFDATFAAPLQWGRYYVPVMPSGTMYLGGGEYTAPRDFLKFGQLALDGGVWHGKRLMARAWVETSLAPHAGLNAPGDYGYTWHIANVNVNGKTYRVENAGGNGGQLLFVVRELDLAVMITAANYGDYRTWSAFSDVIPRYVIPAAL